MIRLVTLSSGIFIGDVIEKTNGEIIIHKPFQITIVSGKVGLVPIHNLFDEEYMKINPDQMVFLGHYKPNPELISQYQKLIVSPFNDSSHQNEITENQNNETEKTEQPKEMVESSSRVEKPVILQL